MSTYVAMLTHLIRRAQDVDGPAAVERVLLEQFTPGEVEMLLGISLNNLLSALTVRELLAVFAAKES